MRAPFYSFSRLALSTWASALEALRMFSRLPVPPCGHPLDLRLVFALFPLVGSLLGLLSGAAQSLASSAGLSPLSSSWVALSLYLYLGFSFHFDGFLDVVDGWASGRRGEEMLRVMKDPGVGSFALAFGVAYLGLRGSLGAEVEDPLWALSACACGGRLSSLSMALLSQRFALGSFKALFPEVSFWQLLPGLSAHLLLFSGWGGLTLLSSLGVVLGVALSLRAFALSRLGGVNGDFLGACEAAAELALLLLLVLRRGVGF